MEYDAELCYARGLLLRDLALARLVKTVKVTAPGPNTEWSQSVPAGVVWDVLGVSFLFTTDANVAQRSNTLIVDDGTVAGIIGQYGMQDIQNAGAAARYTYAALVGFGKTSYSNLAIFGPLPPLSLPAGSRLRTSTALLQAGDAFTGIVLTVREWSEAALADVSLYAAQTLAEQVAQRTAH